VVDPGWDTGTITGDSLTRVSLGLLSRVITLRVISTACRS
jgi:hypothetical protein